MQNIIYLVILSTSLLWACTKEEEPEIDPPDPTNTTTAHETIINRLTTEYVPMPEQVVTINADSSIYAQFAQPVTRYNHGILGDAIEAGQLVVYARDTFLSLELAEVYVYEDIRPRLKDVDQDGIEECITIRSHINEGAGIVIYKILEDHLEEFAKVEEIGTPNRWLNIAAIDNLDEDEAIEIAWIQTPHIGGILKVADIQPGIMEPFATVAQYSNHAIGQRNLCLSVLTQPNNQAVLYVPSQDRQQLAGFYLDNQNWVLFETIEQNIDFAEILQSQYPFTAIVADPINCIAP